MLRSYGLYASHTSYRTNCARIEIRNDSNESLNFQSLELPTTQDNLRKNDGSISELRS